MDDTRLRAAPAEPRWLAALSATYVAGEASLFVLVVADRQAVLTALVQRFSASREIVGVLGTDGATFPNLGDHSRFEQLWQARRVLAGRRDPPGDGLARAWAVLEVGAVSQGWIVRDGEALARARTASAAPPLAEWAGAPRLRDANHVVVVLTADLARIDPALAAAACVLDATPPPPAEEPVATVERSVPLVAAPEDLGPRLAAALNDYLPGWPAAAYASRAPFLAAITEVLANTGAIEPVTVRYADEAGLELGGPGAARFQATWSADLALDAALGTLSRGWEPPVEGFPPGGIPEPDATGLRVLTRRLTRGFFAAQAV